MQNCIVPLRSLLQWFFLLPPSASVPSLPQMSLRKEVKEEKKNPKSTQRSTARFYQKIAGSSHPEIGLSTLFKICFMMHQVIYMYSLLHCMFNRSGFLSDSIWSVATLIAVCMLISFKLFKSANMDESSGDCPAAGLLTVVSRNCCTRCGKRNYAYVIVPVLYQLRTPRRNAPPCLRTWKNQKLQIFLKVSRV